MFVGFETVGIFMFCRESLLKDKLQLPAKISRPSMFGCSTANALTPAETRVCGTYVK